MIRFFSWIFTVLFAFSLGTSVGGTDTASTSDSELRQKVRDHMDIIADESAAMVDDVVDELRQNEYVQKAEDFANDVDEILDNTLDDIKNHFGDDEKKDETAEEAVEEVEGELKDAEEELKDAAGDIEDAAEQVGEQADEEPAAAE